MANLVIPNKIYKQKSIYDQYISTGLTPTYVQKIGSNEWINTANLKVPRYSFSDAMVLAPYGYTGIFGRSKSKETLGLLGTNWQQYYALSSISRGIAPPQFTLSDKSPDKVINDVAAASPITAKRYKNLLSLYATYSDKYGATGYAERYGHTPTLGSKYGIMFNLNNRAIRQEDVLATQQNNLSETSVRVAKDLISQGNKTNQPALVALGQQYLGYADYKLGSSRSKPDPKKIKEMQGAIQDLVSVDPRITKFLMEHSDTSTFDRVATAAVGGFFGLMTGGASGAAIGAGLGASEAGNKDISKALDYMNGLSDSDVLKSRKTYWNLSEAPSLTQYGLIGVGTNFLRGLGRMGTGYPTGVAILTDEAYFAGKETVNWATNDNYEWGQNTDFKLGDAFWKDYAQRYYDVFAVDSKGKGQHWWEGLNDPTAWDALGEKINSDPAAYVLDAISLVPVVGWAAKAGAVASTTARFGRAGMLLGKAGITIDEVEAVRAGALRQASGPLAEYTLDDIKGAQQFIDSLNENPHLIDLVDQSTIEEAARIAGIPAREVAAKELLTTLGERPSLIENVDEAVIKEAGQIVNDVDARAELVALTEKVAQAPSPRQFRRTVRAAMNGEKNAIDELARWRALGYEFNGAEKSFAIRASSVFEARTKVLSKPASVLADTEEAIYRLPASPLARAFKEGYFWVGRGFDRAALSAAEKGGLTGRVGAKLLDMPLLSYRYNYTKAINLEGTYRWGDTAAEMDRAATILKINQEADIPGPMRRAIEALLMGGEGDMPLQYPAIQRQQIRDKINALPRDKRTGKVVKAARADLAMLERKLSDLLDNTIEDVNKAASSYDDLFDRHYADLKARLADATFKADDKVLDKAVDLYRRMDRQDQAVRSRIMHEDTIPTTVEQLKMLYTEAMDGLRLSKRRLFGKDGKTGRVGKFTDKVLRVNTNMLLLRMGVKDRADILNLAQKSKETGTVFDDIKDPALRAEREQQMIDAVEALQRHGMFIDALGSYGSPGRPVLVRANVNVGDDFVAFHIPTLRHTMENGRVYNGRIIDTSETFVLPKVFFSARKKGKGAVIVENSKQGQKLLYEGALNAMSNVYPKARFYSEKLNDTGQKGVRANEQMIANEHYVAQSGLRQHALSRIVKSQIYYLRSRIERDLRNLAESQAVIVPAAQVSGKESSKSGYQILHNIRIFDNIDDALSFASLRGVRREAEKAFNDFTSGNLRPVESWVDVSEGMGYIMADGKPRFVVRGGAHDWLWESMNEDITKHSTTSAWIAREFSDPLEVPSNGYVLAIPNRTYRSLSEMTIESDTLVTRLLNNTTIKGWGNLFKWFVLNANPSFIPNNVIGGLAMMMLYNPAVSGRLLSTAIQKMARESIQRKINNDWFTHQLTTFKNDSESVARQLAYENEYNIYKQDAGLEGAVQGVPWFKKYVFYGGYTAVSAWEEMMRRNVAMQFLRNDAGFQSFMRGPEVKKYIESGIDWNGNIRSGEDAITQFEAATDLLLDRGSPFFDAQLKHRMRYTTNTVSGNYVRFTPTEQLLRNVVAPFYSWMRHSATFTYRMFVDKPITTNAVYNLAQQGYLQNAEQGVPEWMMATMPAPQVVKDIFGITDPDFRIDGGIINPFGTTGDMGRAAFQTLTGTDMGKNLFEFGNPYLNELIQSTLGVDPRTGAIDWKRLKENGMSPQGLAGMGKDFFFNIFKATYPSKLIELTKYNEYEQDALANKYAAIDNAPDILKNYDPSNPDDPWRLSIPKMRTTMVQDPTQRVMASLGIKTYRLNPSTLPYESRRDAVGAIVLKYITENQKSQKAGKALSAAEEWVRRYDYVTQVWVPKAIAQGVPEAQIQFVLNKIEDERPKSTIAKRLTAGIGG